MGDEAVGYLTWEQFNRFQWAVNNSRNLVPWLMVAGFIKSADSDPGVRGSVLGHANLSGPYLAADAITRLLMDLNGFPELEDAANDEWGAELAALLTREVETARARWPFEDRAHYVRYIRCPACNHLSLRYHPPRFNGDRIVVRCMLCQHVTEEDEFAVMAHNQEKELAGRLGDDRTGDGESESVA